MSRSNVFACITRILATAATAAFVLAGLTAAHAAVLTWGGQSGDTWDTSTQQWLDGGMPATWNSGTPDQAIFGVTGAGTLNVGNGISANRLTFDAAGYTLQGKPITLGGTTPTITANADATITSILSGTLGLTKSGGGTLTLTGANNYTGATTINSGVLTYSGSGGNNNGQELLVGGVSGRAVLNLNSSGTFTYGTSAGNVRVGGNAGDADTGVGAVNQTAGNVTLARDTSYLELGVGGNGGTYGAYLLAGGSLTTTSLGGIRVGYGGVGSFTQTGGTLNVGRWFAIGGSKASGNGVVTLSGGTASVHSKYRILVGDATRAKGSFNLGTQAGGSAVVTTPNSGGVVMRGDATATINLNAGTLVLGGAIQRSTGGGTSVLNLNGGTLRANSTGITLISNINGLTGGNVYNGGLVVDTQAYTATISANLLATTGNGIYTSGGVINLPTPAGEGYIGAPLVTVSGGSGTGTTAIANIDAATGKVTGVTLTSPGQGYQTGDTVSFAFTGGGATTAAATFDYQITPADLAANGSGGLTKNGSGQLTLSGNNTYTGPTTVAAGVLALSGSGSISGSTTIDVASGATLDVSGVSDNPWTLGASQTLEGNGTVYGGLTAAGHIAPGNSIGMLDVSGDLTISGTLDVEYDGDRSLIDLLAVTGNLDISGATVDFSPLNSALTGSPHIFASYGSLTGSQFNVVADLPAGYTIDYNYAGNNIALIPEPTAALLAGLGALGLLRRRRHS